MSHPMEKHIIMAVHITERTKRVPDVQNYLTEYGCFIKTRLGLHEASKDFCSPNGLIILEMLDDDTKTGELLEKLNAVEGVEAKTIAFDHP